MVWPLQLEIAGRMVGDACAPFLIAEAGVNHNGSLERALQMVDAAADAGIPCIKFQTFRADSLAAGTAEKSEYQKRSTGGDGGQREMLHRLELTPAEFERIAKACGRRGILFLSTPFDEESSDFLDALGMPVFKLSSGDLTNIPLLGHIAGKKRPMILSTGMACMDEIDAAVDAVKANGCPALILLQCVSSYPASAAACNLRAMDTLATEFGTPVGFSDHTLGMHVGLAAVARGACVVEKHFTLDRALPGPDHQASAEVSELKSLWEQMQEVYLSLGDGKKIPRAEELENCSIARRSLHWRRDLLKGARIERADLIALRPEGGISPVNATALVGRRVRTATRAGTFVMQEDLEP